MIKRNGTERNEHRKRTTPTLKDVKKIMRREKNVYEDCLRVKSDRNVPVDVNSFYLAYRVRYLNTGKSRSGETRVIARC